MGKLKEQQSLALRFVNQVRKALDKEPIRKLPKGIPCRAGDCPLALAIEDDDVQVDGNGIEFKDNPVKTYVVAKALGYPTRLDNPFTGLTFVAPISRFVKDFDNGKYPELVDLNTLVNHYNNNYVD